MQKIANYKTTFVGVDIITDKNKKYTISSWQLADIFVQYGGSFMKAIGTALQKADHINTRKILETWENEAKIYIEDFILPNFTEDAEK